MKTAKRALCIILALALCLSLMPAALASAVTSFNDVKATDWYWNDVQYISEKGLMSGTGTLFLPGKNVTRGMFAAILYRLDGAQLVNELCPFADVAKDAYYRDAVIWAAKTGIVTGKTPTDFAPDADISREQLSAMLYRYAVYKGYGTSARADLSGYSDSGSISSYAKDSMAWAVAVGLIGGTGASRIEPKGTATRAQTAAMLARFCRNIVPAPKSVYTVTFSENYAGAGADTTAQVNAGEKVAKPGDPVRSGYVFDGWYTAASGGDKYNFDSAVTSAMTLYAQWKASASGSLPVITTGGGKNGSVSISISNTGYDEADSRIVTNEDTIKLCGDVTSTYSLKSVSVKYEDYNEDGGSAKVAGKTSWSSQVPLGIGTNAVTVSATDSHNNTVSKVVYVDRVNDSITYSENVKTADATDYQRIKDGIVACWSDNNGTEDDASDDYIVMLARDDSLLIKQISEGLLKKGEVYIIPQNDIFVTGFSGVFERTQAPRGTENYPISSYSDSGYEEIIFDVPGLDDILSQDVSIDYSQGIDESNPIAFAMLADGTPVDVQASQATGDEPYLSSVASMSQFSSATTGSEDDNKYNHPGWQLDQLAKNIFPSLKVSTSVIGGHKKTDVNLKWKDVVIYDKDGIKNDGTVNKGDELKLSGTFGITGLTYSGGVEWHPNWNPWSLDLMPQQVKSKLSYDFGGSMELNGEASVSTTELVKKLNGGFDNKAEFWGLSVSGVDSFKGKIVIGSIGFNLASPATPYISRSISGQATTSKVTPTLVLMLFMDLNGNLSVEGSLEFGYQTSVTKGFNFQKNGFSGGYGTQNQNRSDNHYTVGNDHTLDVYDENTGNFKLSINAKFEAAVDVGVGVGAGVMIAGFCPAMVNGEVFYRASGVAQGKIEFLPELKAEGNAALYNGVGVQADLALKALLKTKIGKAGIDYNKHYEHMLWENNMSTSSLKGTVYISDNDGDNSNNSKLSGATVTLTNNSTGASWTATTNQKGEYVIFGIPDGSYTLTVEKDGFNKYTDKKVQFETRGTVDIFIDKQAPVDGICSLSGKVTIADKDTDLTNNKPLEGASIVLAHNTQNLCYHTVTNANGSYNFAKLPAGNYTITISKDGYLTILESVSIADNTQNHYSATIEAISCDNKGDGVASGLVYDAINGNPVSGLTLNIRSGVDVTSGTITKTVTTDSSGAYSTGKIPAGNYTAEIVDGRQLTDETNRYYSSTFTIKILGDTSIPNQNGYVTNGLHADQLRIVLKWGSSPSDLDSHLVGPTASGGRFHTFYNSKDDYESNTMMANLDLDDRSSYGPETTTIYQMSDGIYTFMVHDYSNREASQSSSLANSGARVEVYLGTSNIAAKVFYVPAQDGTLWTVFSYNSVTGEIIEINTMDYQSSSSSVGSTVPVSNSPMVFTSVRQALAASPEIANPPKDYELVK